MALFIGIYNLIGRRAAGLRSKWKTIVTQLKAEFRLRQAGGADNASLPVSRGRAIINTIYGKTVKWNQLVDANTTSVTLESGKKYYTKISGTASIVTGSGSSIAVTGGVDTVINLTDADIDNLTTVADVEAWVALNVGTQDYYPYNAGSLINFTGTTVQTTKSGVTVDTCDLSYVYSLEDGQGNQLFPEGLCDFCSVDAETATNGSLKIILDGSESYSYNSTQKVFYLNTPFGGLKDTQIVVPCTHFKDVDYATGVGDVSLDNIAFWSWISGNNGTIAFRRLINGSNVTNFKNYIASLHQAGTPVTFICPTLTPTTIIHNNHMTYKVDKNCTEEVVVPTSADNAPTSTNIVADIEYQSK